MKGRSPWRLSPQWPLWLAWISIFVGWGGCVGESWRGFRPQVRTEVTVRTPALRAATLRSGLVLLAYESPSSSLVTAQVAFRAGSAAAPAGRAGLAQLTYGLLPDGTLMHDGVALAEAFDAIGATPEVRVLPDGAILQVQVLAPHAERALSLLSEVARYPRFAPEDIEERRAHMRDDLLSRAGSPEELGQRALSFLIYGERHPYGGLALPTERTLRGLRREDVVRFYERHVGPRTTAVVVTGQVSFAAVQGLAERYFGDWRTDAAPADPWPSPPPRGPRRAIVVVPKPALVQTRILMGQAGVPAGHRDEHALRVASALYSERLSWTLREGQGYTYGASSGLSLLRGGGCVLAATAVRADATGAALQEAMEQLGRLRGGALSREELYRGRARAVWAMTSLFRTLEGVGQAAAGLYLLGQPFNRYHVMVSEMQALEAAQVEDALYRYFDPDQMQIVLVGDLGGIRRQVSRLGLGELVLFGAEGPL